MTAHHFVIQIGAIVRDDLPRQTIPTDNLPLNEPDHHTPSDASVRRGFNPLTEVIDRH